MPPVHFTTGLSDFFDSVANGGTNFHSDLSQINQMLDRVLDYNARTMRIAVSWGTVETSPSVFDWCNYNPLIFHAGIRNLRILPTVWDAPDNDVGKWGFPTRTIIKPDNTPGLSYPYTQEGYTAYGNFVAETLSYFGSYGVTRAVEAWNEPNQPKYLGEGIHNGVDAEYEKMLNAALDATMSRTYPFPYTVISGGLAQTRSNWQDFMYDIWYYNQCFEPYSVGIHPYVRQGDRFPDTMDRDDAIDLYVHDVKSNFNDAKDIWQGDFWITEFGCPSGEPFGRLGRSAVLEQLVGTDGFFDSRARCKAVFLYRLLPQSFLKDDTGPNSWFSTFPLLRQTNDPPDVPPFTFSEEQPVQGMLNSNWAGAGFFP